MPYGVTCHAAMGAPSPAWCSSTPAVLPHGLRVAVGSPAHLRVAGHLQAVACTCAGAFCCYTQLYFFSTGFLGSRATHMASFFPPCSKGNPAPTQMCYIKDLGCQSALVCDGLPALACSEAPCHDATARCALMMVAGERDRKSFTVLLFGMCAISSLCVRHRPSDPVQVNQHAVTKGSG